MSATGTPLRPVVCVLLWGCATHVGGGESEPHGEWLLDTGVVSLTAVALPAVRGVSVEPGDKPAQLHVEASGPIACPSPGARDAQPFDTLAAPYADPRPWVRMWGAGVVAADFDDDGRTDVIMLGGAGSQYFRQGVDGRFVNTAETDLVSVEPLNEVFGGSVADFDGDGALDLYVTRYKLPNVLLRNDGRGRFSDVTERFGLGLGNHRSGSSSWVDFDRDGDLDLFVAGHGRIIEDGSSVRDFPPGESSFLLENTGSGFVDRSALLPEELHDGYTFVGGWHDMNGDGWPDLWAINDIGGAQRPCTLVLNNLGTSFTLDGNRSGLDLAISGMGLGVGDLNRDGIDDFVVPAWNEVRFMLSSAAGVWIDHSRILGVHGNPELNQVVGWGAEVADMDNDGDLDIPMVFGFIDTQLSDNRAGQPDALFLHDADGQYHDVAAKWGVANTGYARGLAVADLNNDGWLDMAKPDIDGSRLLQLARCGDAAWLRVGLRMPGMNSHAIGATITIEAEGQVQYRRIYAGGTSYGSSGPPEVHFGLGAAEQVRRITIEWPDGEVSELRDVDARQVLTIPRREG